MFDSPDAEAYIERAEMHEQLAANTADIPARKMRSEEHTSELQSLV